MKKSVKNKKTNVVVKNKFLKNFIIIGVVVLILLFIFAMYSGKKEADREDELASIWDIGILSTIGNFFGFGGSEDGGDEKSSGIIGGGGDEGPISGSSGDVSWNIDVDLGGVSKLQVEDECYCMPEGGEEVPPLVGDESMPMLSYVFRKFITSISSILENNMVQAALTIGCGIGSIKVCQPGDKTKGKIRQDYVVDYFPSDPIEVEPTAPTIEKQIERFCNGRVDSTPVPMPSPSPSPNPGVVGVTDVSLSGGVAYITIYTNFNEYPSGALKYILVPAWVDNIASPEVDYIYHSSSYPAALFGATGALQGDIQIYLYKVPAGLDKNEQNVLKGMQDSIKRHEEVHVEIFQRMFTEIEMLINGITTVRGATHPEFDDGMHVPEGPYDSGTDPITPHVQADLGKGVDAAISRAKKASDAFHECIKSKENDPNFWDNHLMGPPFEEIRGIRCYSAELEDALTEACKGEAGV